MGLPVENSVTVPDCHEWFERQPWQADRITKTFGLMFGCFIPVRIMAVPDMYKWHVSVDTKPFDDYYGEGACYKALVDYLRGTRLPWDKVEPEPGEVVELVPLSIGGQAEGELMTKPGGDLARCPRQYAPRRQKPGEKLARRRGKESLRVEKVAAEGHLSEEEEEPEKPKEAPVAWAKDVMKGGLTERVNLELYGRDPFTGRILRPAGPIDDET
jgi:hypothetical protein